jgi:hypothetical protein
MAGNILFRSTIFFDYMARRGRQSALKMTAHRRMKLGTLALASALSFMVGTTAAVGGLKFHEPRSSPVAAGQLPWAIVVADLDGDADQDLAIANEGSADVTILLNNGSGSFTQPASSPVGVGSYPEGIAAADLDGDGDQDLAVASSGSLNLSILLNNGSGKFTQPASSPAVGYSPIAIAAADLDGDGDQDLAVANRSSDSVTILRNIGSAKFREFRSSPVAVGTSPHNIVAADLDGDGDQDLAVALTGTGRNVAILRNIGSGKFREFRSSPLAVGVSPEHIAAADLDGDGDQDLAVTSAEDDLSVPIYQVTILINNGSGKFTQPASSPVAVGVDGPHGIAAADLDGDGDQDLAVANGTVTILRNNGSGKFTEPASSPVALNSALDIVAADLDGDGDQDLAVANTNSDNVTILIHDLMRPGRVHWPQGK